MRIALINERFVVTTMRYAPPLLFAAGLGGELRLENSSGLGLSGFPLLCRN